MKTCLSAGSSVTGTQPKRLIVRAVGPSSGVEGALGDPQLQIFDGDAASFAFNNNWEDAPNRQEIIDITVAPSDARVAGFLSTLTPGNYTAVVSGVNSRTGLAVIEVYDLDRSAESRLANIATRGLVQTGDDVMIGGLIVLGDAPLRG